MKLAIRLNHYDDVPVTFEAELDLENSMLSAYEQMLFQKPYISNEANIFICSKCGNGSWWFGTFSMENEITGHICPYVEVMRDLKNVKMYGLGELTKKRFSIATGNTT